MSRVAGDSDLEVAVSDIAPLEDTEETSEDTQREENWREERWESDRKIAVNAERYERSIAWAHGSPGARLFSGYRATLPSHMKMIHGRKAQARILFQVGGMFAVAVVVVVFVFV